MNQPVTIPPEAMPALEGFAPTVISTCSADGIPNITYVSQVFYVDPQHVAISWQFMNKTARNLLENPYACAYLFSPYVATMWKVHLRLVEKQTEGPVFERMDMQMQAIMSLMPVKPDFKIQAALICRVEAIEKVFNINEVA